ncbi:MAG: serine--tRNA ligase [Planctomycetota bacterium]
MLDSKRVRENPDGIRTALARRGGKPDLEPILELERARRALQTEVQALKAKRNQISEEVARLKREKKDADALVAESRTLGEQIAALDTKGREAEGPIADLLLRLPNVPAADVPDGTSAEQNVEVRRFLEPAVPPGGAKPHWDIAERLGLIDFARAGNISGSGFGLYTGTGARLVRALVNFMLDLHTAKGYREILPPYLVTRDCMVGTGQLPKFEEDMYRLRDDALYLIPTAEVPVTNMHRGEILGGKDLPIRYTAYSACFRREAGTYGKDTRGIVRVHQFDKVELVKFAAPETSYAELESLTADAEEVLKRLGLCYRVLKLCAGDLGFASAKTYDLELWAPGLDRWLEVSSCSNFEDFQARRANIRFRGEDKKVRFVHTLNGSGVAIPRLFIALLECGLQADGSVLLPEAIRPYLGGMERIG